MSSRDTRLTMLFYLKQMYAYFLWQRFSPPSVKIIIVGLGSCCHYILYQLFSCFFPSKIMIFVWFKWLYRCMLSSFRQCALFFISQDIVHFLFSQTYDKSQMVNGPCLKGPHLVVEGHHPSSHGSICAARRHGMVDLGIFENSKHR